MFNKSTAQIYYVRPEDSAEEDPPPYVAASLALRGPRTKAKELDYMEHTKDELCNIVESRGLTALYQPTKRILARILETDDWHKSKGTYAKLDLSELKALTREREIESELPEQTIISKLWQQDEEGRKGDASPSSPGTEQSVAVYPVRTQLVLEGNAVDSKSQIKWHVPFSPQDMRAILEGLGDPRKNPTGFANKLSAAQEAYEASATDIHQLLIKAVGSNMSGYILKECGVDLKEKLFTARPEAGNMSIRDILPILLSIENRINQKDSKPKVMYIGKQRGRGRGKGNFRNHGNRGPIICYNCDGEGHIAKFCHRPDRRLEKSLEAPHADPSSLPKAVDQA
ncbi:hypothetical protein AB205_0020260 [Aquarana catesbeiana]|uniref:CCHC-type domain-containing protein n=1 Tax=Aquarana catesbeiana TaxID=8400 RepID=A0A2G9S0Q4_AQUCT|nr:hypothetical protein AB205_0020260 [Aquarana catesbeiana]